jgi:hypothetical protein
MTEIIIILSLIIIKLIINTTPLTTQNDTLKIKKKEDPNQK